MAKRVAAKQTQAGGSVTLDTMPLVMLRESPPRGYPATSIESCRAQTVAESAADALAILSLYVLKF